MASALMSLPGKPAVPELRVNGRLICIDCGSALDARGACPRVDRTDIGCFQRERKACGHRERSTYFTVPAIVRKKRGLGTRQ